MRLDLRIRIILLLREILLKHPSGRGGVYANCFLAVEAILIRKSSFSVGSDIIEATGTSVQAKVACAH